MATIDLKDIHYFSGKAIFSEIKSTSNLVTPSFSSFIDKVKESYDKGALTNINHQVEKFEAKLARLHGTSHCVSFCNGLWGIVLTIKELAAPGKTEIIMPAMTYRRLADIAAWLNLIPYFCDVDAKSLGATVETVETCINKNTALLLIAQPIVKVCDMQALEQLAIKYQVPIIFDSVEAGAGTCGGRKIGSFGDAECFSMHASKLINAFEAGYITTNNEKLAERLRILRNSGFNSKGDVIDLGLNTHLNEMHAAMGLAGLEDLEDQILRNKKRYLIYKENIHRVKGVSLVEYNETEKRGYKNILIKLEGDWPYTREETLRLMHSDNMLARPYYFPPLYKKETSYKTISGNVAVAEELSKQFILMPSGDFLSTEDVFRIVEYLQVIGENSNLIKEHFKNAKV